MFCIPEKPCYQQRTDQFLDHREEAERIDVAPDPVACQRSPLAGSSAFGSAKADSMSQFSKTNDFVLNNSMSAIRSVKVDSRRNR